MGEDLRSSGVGLRGFESHPPHYYARKWRWLVYDKEFMTEDENTTLSKKEGI